MKLSKSIKKVLSLFLNHEITVLSWGVTAINIQEKTIDFSVNGLKYKGTVSIMPKDSLYCVLLGDKTIMCTDWNLIYCLDNEIEKTENYSDELEKKLLNIISK